MESLKGSFLIATPQMSDPRFQKQVVYICAHSDEEGAMGLVVNHPSPHNLADILRGAELAVPDILLPQVYLGGPVELESAFFLYTAKYETENYIAVSENVRISRDVEILRDISNAILPPDFIFLIGYSGWAPGQLEHELTDNGWLTLPADEDVLFSTQDDLKWQKAAERYGIDISIFGDVVGSA